MDAADLRLFEAVARLGAMNRAAAELNTVQSILTSSSRNMVRDQRATSFGKARGSFWLSPEVNVGAGQDRFRVRIGHSEYWCPL